MEKPVKKKKLSQFVIAQHLQYEKELAFIQKNREALVDQVRKKIASHLTDHELRQRLFELAVERGLLPDEFLLYLIRNTRDFSRLYSKIKNWIYQRERNGIEKKI